jgi:hypothetical protein
MKPDSTAAYLFMWLLVTHPVSSRPPAPDLYVEIDLAVPPDDDGPTVDVIVGNRGDAVNRDNFDAYLEVLVKGRPVCHATTNFITPIGPGQSIQALRFELHPENVHSTSEPYTVRAAILFWDRVRGGTQKITTVALPPGRARCIALKPVQ